MLRRLTVTAAICVALLPALLVGRAIGQAAADEPLVVYCGRGKSLVGPLLERFTEKTGIETEVRYAGSTDLASLLITEGRRTPADVFFSQDPGALGAVADRGLLAELSGEILRQVDAAFRSPDGKWVGMSGRARVIAWSTERLSEGEVPESVFTLTEPKWRGRVGWAPPNASFQLFVTAMRHVHGEATTRRWLEAMQANDVQEYPKNRPIIQAIADGEIDLGLVNHYYLSGFRRSQGSDFPVENKYPTGDVGGLMSVAGAGVLATSDQTRDAERLVQFLLSDEAQRYFANETGEYPLVDGVASPEGAPPRPEVSGATVADLGDLSDLQGTLRLLRETGALP